MSLLKSHSYSLLAIAAVLLTACPALAGRHGGDSNPCVKIDFRGHGGKKSSHTFSKSGLSVTATGGTYTYGTDTPVYTAGAKVGQYSHGLGVTNGKQSGDSHTVDGYNNTYSDVLILKFNKAVELTRVFFGYADAGDKVQIMDADLDTVLGTYSLTSAGSGYYKVKLPGFVGMRFGIRAPGHGDAYKVKAVKVCKPTTIPTPAAGLAGMTLLGLVIAGRRRLA